MSSLRKLSFASGQHELVDSELIVSVPDGFHACTDRSVIGVNELTVLVVPKDCSFYGDASDYELSLSIGESGSMPDPISHENVDAFIDFVLKRTEMFNPKAKVNTLGIRKGGGAIYQLVDCEIALKTIGFVFAKEKFYIFQIIWNHQGTEIATNSVVEEFKKQAESWINRIRRIDEKDLPTLESVTPSKELYPHYNHIRNSTKNIPGVITVVNATGTEYEFIPLKREDTPVCDRIAAIPLEEFPLSDTAWNMASIFRVHKSIFDPKHDRECQLKNGYMHRAYMMSALRSFFWTTDAYCEDNSITPEELTEEDVTGIVEHIKQRNWLNYTDDTHGSDICRGQDYHVYYVPEETELEDIDELMPSREDRFRVWEMQNKMPGYFEVLSDVRYLEELRYDLQYIYPAVRIIYDELSANRDPYQPLVGDKADVLYAWCALTIAAKEPFFSEDGPVNCWFEQEEDNSFLPESKTQKQVVEKTNVAVNNKQPSEKKKENSIPPALPISPSATDIDPRILHRDECKIWDQEFGGYNGPKEEIILPSGIAIIDSFCEFADTVRTIIVPDGVTTIEEYAFSKCSNLETVEFPDSVVFIGESAFSGRSGLKDINIPNSVTYIGESAFWGCSSLESVSIPEGVTIIEDDTFWNCTGLKNITIPKSVKSIGDNAFDRCTSLISATIPYGVTSIGEEAFSSCSSLTSFMIPDSVTSVGDSTFFGCKALNNVRISKNLSKISNQMFEGCEGLTDVIIPSGVESIGYGAFLGCDNLERVTIPKSVVSIGEEAFCECSNLANITIPSGVRSIGACAFQSCPKLATITIPSSVEQIGVDCFDGCDGLTCAFVVKGSYAEQYFMQLGIECQYFEESEQDLSAAEKMYDEVEEESYTEDMERKAAEDQERKAEAALKAQRDHYEELVALILEQKQIIEQNTGWFGKTAKARKEAQEKLDALYFQIAREFPHGKP